MSASITNVVTSKTNNYVELLTQQTLEETKLHSSLYFLYVYAVLESFPKSMSSSITNTVTVKTVRIYM